MEQTPVQVIKQKIDEAGIGYKKLAERCGLETVKLYQAFSKCPHRRLQVYEFIALCNYFDLKLEDFQQCNCTQQCGENAPQHETV